MSRQVLVLAVLVACGSSPSNSIDGKPADAAHDDFGCGGSAACTTDQTCCAMPSGSATTFGCATSCPAPDQINCDGPQDCSGATPVCCGVDVANGMGQFPQCGVTSLGTSCTAASSCATHLANSCTDTSKVQLCRAASDCTDSTNNKCCTFASGAASLTFCIDSTTASLGGATCH